MQQQRLFLSALTMIFFVVQGCLEDPSSDSPGGDGYACTEMGSLNTIDVTIRSTGELPPNLVATLNGSNEIAEFCEISEDSELVLASTVIVCFAGASLSVVDGRKEANLRFLIDEDRSNFEQYFSYPDPFPIDDLVNLQILTRDSCEDEPRIYRELEDLTILWEPVYANGEECGVTSHKGHVEIDFGDGFF